MFKGIAVLYACGVVVSAAGLNAQDVFVLPGAGSQNNFAQAFVTNPLGNFRTFNTAPGSFTVLPTRDASKFFFVGTSTANSIIAMDGMLLQSAVVASLSPSASQAIITPDGNLLAVVAGTLHLFNTATNAELVPNGISQGVGFSTVGVAASLDSTSLFALGSNGSDSGVLTAINTTSYSVTGTLQLAEVPTAVSVGPNGLVYVSMPNRVLEVDPRTLQVTFNGTIYTSGTPGPLTFTPDGLYALGVNQSGFGNSLILVTLANHTSSDPPVGLQEITSLQATGLDTVLVLSSQGVYELTVSGPTTVTASPVQASGAAPGSVIAAAISNDVPTANHTTIQAVFLATATSLYQYTPSSNTVLNPSQISPAVTPGALSYEVPARTLSTSQPATLVTHGNNQSILPNTTSEPLVVQVLDPNNLPISGYNVRFQISGAGATLYNSSSITGTNGSAVTYVTASATTGTVTVTATVQSLSTTFTVNVSSTAQGGNSPTLTITAGQGQLMFQGTSSQLGPQYGSPLVVTANDAQGNPLAGLPVTFTIPQSEGTLQILGVSGASTQTVNTNADGVASVDFLASGAITQQGFLQATVTASAPNTNTVNFYVTTVPLSPTPAIYILAPSPGATLTGPEGGILAGAVKAQVTSSTGAEIPNVSLTLVGNNANTSLYPSASCNAPGGFALSNAQGIAVCDVVFGPRVGSGSFTTTVGFTRSAPPTQFVVTTGAPATVQITQGNNQSGGPGQKLPGALVVNVTDSGGNTVSGAAVNWQVLTAGSVILSNVISVTDSNGNASAIATLGSIGGVAKVTATAGAASATFNLTVNIPAAGLQKVSGDQQTALLGTAFALPLTVEVVDANGNGVNAVQVNFQVTSGVATLGSAGAITTSSGQAFTTVTAGNTVGPIVVTATSGSFSTSFTLTARPPGPYNITIVNGASFDPNTGISPGGIATIRGMGILPGVTGLLPAANSSGQLPTTFSGVTITFNGTAAPIYYVEDTNGADQVSVQVPFEVQPGPAVAMEVNVANQGSKTIMIPVKPFAPGIFTSTYGGKPYAVAVRPDGSYVSPTNPAQRGENLQLYVTGLGEASPVIATGAFGVANQTVTAPLIVGLNNGGVPLISAVYGPGLIGVYVVILQVPANTQTGPYQPVGLIAYDSANNAYYAQNTYIPIE